MQLLELCLLAVGLSMDAFAVSICRGLSHHKLKHSLEAGLYFGIFQGVMPLLGYLLGLKSFGFMTDMGHWISFALLLLIGLNMLRGGEEEEKQQPMVLLALATSIDAFAVGTTLALIGADIFSACLLFTLITFLFSAVGVQLGGAFGTKYSKQAEKIGGILLIAIGVKILATGLMG